MERKSIPNWTRGSSPIPTPSSRPFGPSGDPFRFPASDCQLRKLGTEGANANGLHRFCTTKTSNIQHPTSNIQMFALTSVRCWMLDVGCWMFNPGFSGRVMGAWWPSRSSKPPLARFTGRGVFDSLPLRHFDFRFSIFDFRFWRGSRRCRRRVNRKSQIANPKGGVAHEPRADS